MGWVIESGYGREGWKEDVVLFSRNLSTFLGGVRVCVCVVCVYDFFAQRATTYVCSSSGSSIIEVV